MPVPLGRLIDGEPDQPGGRRQRHAPGRRCARVSLNDRILHYLDRIGISTDPAVPKRRNGDTIARVIVAEACKGNWRAIEALLARLWPAPRNISVDFPGGAPAIQIFTAIVQSMQGADLGRLSDLAAEIQNATEKLHVEIDNSPPGESATEKLHISGPELAESEQQLFKSE